MRSCPNCHRSAPDGGRLCPHCGEAVTDETPSPVWPPPPTDGPLPRPRVPEPVLLTRTARGDMALGFFVTLGGIYASMLMTMAGLGLIGAAFLFFLSRASRPAFARGILYGLMAALLLLGVIALYLYEFGL